MNFAFFRNKFFGQGRAWATQALRYSALEAEDYVFPAGGICDGLKCLVPESLRLVRNAVGDGHDFMHFSS